MNASSLVGAEVGVYVGATPGVMVLLVGINNGFAYIPAMRSCGAAFEKSYLANSDKPAELTLGGNPIAFARSCISALSPVFVFVFVFDVGGGAVLAALAKVTVS